jgi:hypothetical protein
MEFSSTLNPTTFAPSFFTVLTNTSAGTSTRNSFRFPEQRSATKVGGAIIRLLLKKMHRREVEISNPDKWPEFRRRYFKEEVWSKLLLAIFSHGSHAAAWEP